MSQTATKGRRQVRGVFANYYGLRKAPDGETRRTLCHAERGQTIEDPAPGEVERLDRLGALMPKGGEVAPEEVEDAIARAISPTHPVVEEFGHPPNVASPGAGVAPRQGTIEDGLPRTDAPDVADTAALSQFILEQKLNAADTVALAEGDPDRAVFVLEAEKAAHGQDPRATVEKPLNKLIEEEAS